MIDGNDRRWLAGSLMGISGLVEQSCNRTDKMEMKTPRLGTRSGSLSKNLVAHTNILGASGTRLLVTMTDLFYHSK